jgi:S-DNA-T family DNA segregation ATPase FtsK/SpoIIIE
MWSLNKTIFNNMTEAYIIDSQDQQLKKTKEYGFTKRYTVDLGDMPEMLEEIANELEKRLLHISEGGNLDKYPLQLLIIENSDFITAISKDKDCYATFNKITKQYKNLKVAVIFSNIENVAAGYNAPDLLKFFKENRKFIIFEDLQNLKLADTTLKQQKEFSKPIKIGDGYLYFNGEIEKIKTIKSI